MDLLQLLGIALGLAMDAFSVAIAASLAMGTVGRRQSLRLVFAFGFFQFAMPILGWLAGSTVAGYVEDYAHWAAFAILAFVGGRMIWDSIFDHAEGVKRDPTRGVALLVLSLATSVDALAVGVSLALLEVPVLLPAVVIGLVAAAMTFVGLRIGRLAGKGVGPWMERLGGVVLLAIGIKIVLEKTLG